MADLLHKADVHMFRQDWHLSDCSHSSNPISSCCSRSSSTVGFTIRTCTQQGHLDLEDVADTEART